MSETITITINGQELQAEPGAMLIDVADDNNIVIPRFCYHKKLSVAANCRMCLVEVEKAPKPMPACATPCNDGMVVNTRSTQAIEAQKGTMEFLLINHPLDCPICDQGGECELQDVAMGFGEGVSQYTECKRVVKDKDIGPLIAMEMTRCIHCTRCVRFGEEIAGQPELGATGRGENVEIGTYIEKSVTSEMSGNVIDVCPVGALTAKPSRYTARPWELVQHPSIAPHDCVGSNINIHTRNNDLIRVVPRDNESINECWISDRDRFSYTAVNHKDRLTNPMMLKNGMWKSVDWEEGLTSVTAKIQAAANADGNSIAALVNPGCTLEEQYLAQKMIRGLGSNNIDSRLRQVDFSADGSEPVMPWLGRSIESLENLDSCLLVAANLRQEQTILAHRLRKAAVNNGAQISSLVHVGGTYHFDQLEEIVASGESLVHELGAIAVATAKAAKKDLPEGLQPILEKVKTSKAHKAIAESLIKGEQAALIVGQQASISPYWSLIQQLSAAIAYASGATLGYLSDTANSAGAALAGAVPHREEAGTTADNKGQNTREILSAEHQVLLLLGIDPALDISGDEINELKANNNFIVAIDAYSNDFIKENADVILPMSAFTETSGTYVNVEGLWQSFKGCVKPLEEARPGWKILASLGQLLLPGGHFEFNDSNAVRNELKEKCRELELNNLVDVQSSHNKLPSRPRSLQRITTSVMFSGDAMGRRSEALQTTESNQNAISARVNSEQAEKLGVTAGQQVQLKQGEGSASLPIMIDEGVPKGCICLPHGVDAVKQLSAGFGAIELEKQS